MSKKAIQIILLVYAFSLAYAVLRYHVFEGVALKDFPLYVFNKCLGLAGFILLAFNFSLQPARALGAEIPHSWIAARKDIGIVSFMTILAHAFCSMLIFGSGAYYGKFFAENGTLTAVGSWSMLFGVLSFTWLWLYNISFKAPQEADKPLLELIGSKSSLFFVGLLAAGHLVVMGYKGWLNPGDWAGGMPPITLVAFLVYILGAVLAHFGRK